MASDDEDDYIVFGSPLLDESETVAGQYRKAKQDPALTKALPIWQQEVTDAEGRRRFHGAFTGGYSAGFYNTVGSAEGWAPRTFRSTRGQRAESRQQTAEDFMDDDELDEVRAQSLQTRADFDTFGHEATAKARQMASSSQADRPGLPNAVPLELIMPVPDSIGIRLLQKMGWRQGKGVGQETQVQKPGSKWGRMASLGAESVALHSLAHKDDTFGLGFDPFKGAEEFRAGKRPAKEDERWNQAAKKQKRGVAFGTGVLDEDDVYGLAEDYITDIPSREDMNATVVSDEEDDGMPGSSRLRIAGYGERLALPSKADAEQAFDLVPGYVKAKEVETPPSYRPPKVPANFIPTPKLAPPTRGGAAELGKEPPLPRPEVLKAIKTIAPYVARTGPAFEALALQRNGKDPEFAFLSGGEGAAYYRWHLKQQRVALAEATGLRIGQRSAPLTADSRGIMLGEVALASTSPQAPIAAANAAAAPTSIAAGDKQALQETLQSTFARGSQQDMGFSGKPGLSGGSFGLRAGAQPAPLNPAAANLLQAASSRFSSSSTFEGGGPQAAGLSIPQKPQPPAPEATAAKQPRAPRRTIEEWHPAPLLCKRFNVADPYRGKAAAVVKGPASRVDALALPETAAAAASHSLPLSFGSALPGPPAQAQRAGADGQAPAGNRVAQLSQPQQAADQFLGALLGGPGTEVPKAAEGTATPIDKPIDLFKAIFEDESDSDEDDHEQAEAVEDAPNTTHSAAEKQPSHERGSAAAGSSAELRDTRQGEASSIQEGSNPGARGPPENSRQGDRNQFLTHATPAQGHERTDLLEKRHRSQSPKDKKKHRERQKHKHKKEKDHKKSKKSRKERERDRR